MPFYVHESGEDPVETARVCFPTIVEARAAKRNGETVTYVQNREELYAWRNRESRRFNDGTYIRVPWSDYNYDSAGEWVRHYAHLSLNYVGKVAFTKSPEHGMLDRQTVMRPGRYLEEFFGDTYDAETKEGWIAEVSALKSQLKFATTPDDIEQVYVNGPSSCMSHPADNYQSSIHPVRVYGNSDLAIAYIGTLDDVGARAVVWPEKKVFGRIYGNIGVLNALLKQSGYEQADYSAWNGAKLRCVKDGRGFIMPYLDIAETVDVDVIDGKKWCIVRPYDGEYSARCTDGLTGAMSTCEHCGCTVGEDDYYCESCIDSSNLCPHCEDRNWDDNRNGLCDSCDRHYCDCDMCDEHVHEDDTSYLEGQEITVCSDCYRDTVECKVCGDQFLESAYARDIKRQRANFKDVVCWKCQSEGAFFCECGEALGVDDKCDCHASETESETESETKEVATCAS